MSMNYFGVIKQKMNVYECNEEYYHSMKDGIFGFASLTGTFYLSPEENILTIAFIKIHYSYISHAERSEKNIFAVIQNCRDTKG